MTNTDVRSPAPRFRWLDRWLEPRWRALLTWVVLAVIATWMTRQPVLGWIAAPARFIQEQFIQPSLPTISPLMSLSNLATIAFLHVWFPPVVLRLGSIRIAAWIAAGIILYTIYAMGVWPMSVFSPTATFTWPSVGAIFVALALVAGIPGWAVWGRRSRPWVSLLGGSLSACWITAHYFMNVFEPWYDPGALRISISAAISSFIYGAVMLYGTDPLPRRRAERQPDSDHR